MNTSQDDSGDGFDSDSDSNPALADGGLVRPKRPIWLPHFLGPLPLGLEQKYVSLVGVVSLALLFESYDLSMLSAALKQIRESFGLGQSEMSSLVAYIRLGAIPAFLVLPLADRLGRRRVYLWSIA